MPDPLAWIDAEAEAWSQRGLGRRLVALGGSSPGRVDRDGRSLLNFASNDYLGLASDPRVIEAARVAADRYGWGAGASPLVSGWREPHEALASALARFEGAEAVGAVPLGVRGEPRGDRGAGRGGGRGLPRPARSRLPGRRGETVRGAAPGLPAQ